MPSVRLSLQPADLPVTEEDSVFRSFDSAGRRVSEMILADRCQLSETHLEDLVYAIDAVTADDVREAARTHLHPEACSLAVAGPVAKRDVAGLLG